MTFSYTLEPYSGRESRFTCPYCKAEKQFTRYIHTVTGLHLDDSVGKCNRINSCGYHLAPKDFFRSQRGRLKPVSSKKAYPKYSAEKSQQPSFLDSELLLQSLHNYEENNFVVFLIQKFGPEPAKKMVEDYFIGTSNSKSGATIFWQIDQSGNIRTGKEMLYNKDTGKRYKDRNSYFNWCHRKNGDKDFQLVQCLYGEHLLARTKKDLAIVESEKTAVIASYFLPEFTWLATGGFSSLTPGKLSVLKGKSGILYPDLGCYDDWKKKITPVKYLSNFSVSNLLETIATPEQRKKGLDIADYLLTINVTQDINDEICLSSKDIVAAPVQTNLGIDFEYAKMLSIKTKNGGCFDVIFDKDENYLEEQSAFLINKINTFFEKRFRIGKLDGTAVWIN